MNPRCYKISLIKTEYINCNFCGDMQIHINLVRIEARKIPQSPSEDLARIDWNGEIDFILK